MIHQSNLFIVKKTLSTLSNLFKNLFSSAKSIKGFTLIELSLSVLLVSAVATYTLTKYTTGEELTQNDQVVDKLKEIKSAVLELASSQGYYPCPVSNLISTDASEYGEETRTSTGFCDTNEFYNKDEVTTGYIDDGSGGKRFTFDVSSDYNDFYIGAVPCKTLGLSDDCGVDNNGNRLAYAVSNVLSQPNQCAIYIDDAGSDTTRPYSFNILNDYDLGDSLATNITNYDNGDEPHFVVIYYGNDGVGAYPFEGGIAAKKIKALSLGNGTFLGDNAYQEVNHNINSSFDNVFFMPDRPIETPDGSVGSDVAKITFGDVLVWGKSSDVEINTCVHCRSCDDTDPSYSYNEYAILADLSPAFTSCGDYAAIAAVCTCSSDTNCDTSVGECCSGSSMCTTSSCVLGACTDNSDCDYDNTGACCPSGGGSCSRTECAANPYCDDSGSYDCAGEGTTECCNLLTNECQAISSCPSTCSADGDCTDANSDTIDCCSSDGACLNIDYTTAGAGTYIVDGLSKSCDGVCNSDSECNVTGYECCNEATNFCEACASECAQATEATDCTDPEKPNCCNGSCVADGSTCTCTDDLNCPDSASTCCPDAPSEGISSCYETCPGGSCSVENQAEECNDDDNSTADCCTSSGCTNIEFDNSQVFLSEAAANAAKASLCRSACVSDGDCTETGYCCGDDNICSAEACGTEFCDEDRDCYDDPSVTPTLPDVSCCKDGVCVNTSADNGYVYPGGNLCEGYVCTENSHCTGAYDCCGEDGLCYPCGGGECTQATEATDCTEPSLSECCDGTCVSDAEEAPKCQCEIDTECPNGQICGCDGACCTSGIDCPTCGVTCTQANEDTVCGVSEYCCNGSCIDDSVQCNCPDDLDSSCPTGEICCPGTNLCEASASDCTCTPSLGNSACNAGAPYCCGDECQISEICNDCPTCPDGQLCCDDGTCAIPPATCAGACTQATQATDCTDPAKPYCCNGTCEADPTPSTPCVCNGNDEYCGYSAGGTVEDCCAANNTCDSAACGGGGLTPCVIDGDCNVGAGEECCVGSGACFDPLTEDCGCTSDASCNTSDPYCCPGSSLCVASATDCNCVDDSECNAGAPYCCDGDCQATTTCATCENEPACPESQVCCSFDPSGTPTCKLFAELCECENDSHCAASDPNTPYC